MLLHVKDLIPVRVQGLLDNGRGPRLLATNGRNCERVRKSCGRVIRAISIALSEVHTEDIALVESVSCDD